MNHTQTFRAIPVKTRQEIKDLKKEWESNPNWDLHTTPGFEAHKQELIDYQTRKEILWAKSIARRERSAAKSMGLTLDLYKKWKKLKGIADFQKGQSIKCLTDLVFGTLKVDLEQQVEIETIVDHLFRGAINYAKAEMIQEISYK